MKQTLLTRLVLGAIAGLAASGAYAGQIQASSVSIAREAITNDLQAVTAPSIAYRFAGDVDARVQSQTFQVQFTLGAGQWSAAPTATALSISDGVTGIILNQVAAAAASAYTVDTIAVNTTGDSRTVYATITVHNVGGVGVLVKQPIISLNVTTNTVAGNNATNVSAARGTARGLYTVAGDIVADYNTSGICTAVKTLPVSFKHFVALTAPASLATETTATADEHTRGGATNSATLMTFPTNVKVNVTAATGGAVLTPGGNQTFTNNGTVAAAGTDQSFVAANLVNIGKITLAQNAVGYDSDLSSQYVLTGNAVNSGIVGLATAVKNNGNVEASALNVVVTASNGFVVGGNVFLADNAANCAVAIAGSTVPITALNAAGPVTVTVPTGSMLGGAGVFGITGTNPVQVCYNVPSNATIASSSFSAVATLAKSAAGTNLNEQNNVCNGNLYSLGGGIKIDVRNYASSKETSGYQSVIRLINNSDVRTADVWGQIIHQDGKFGGWGKITDLAPRAVLNLTAAQVDALMTNTPNNGTAANNGSVPSAASATGAPRLRITSNSGSTLRVQNYLFNSATGQILEGSGSQGVDYDLIAGRTPAPATDGQLISQDAESGLNGR